MHRWTVRSALIVAMLSGVYVLMRALAGSDSVQTITPDVSVAPLLSKTDKRHSLTALLPTAAEKAPQNSVAKIDIADTETELDMRALAVLFQTLQVSPDDKIEPLGAEAWRKLRNATNRSASFREHLRQRYETEIDENARSIIVTLLSGLATPDVIEFSRRLYASEIARHRTDALQLIASQPTAPETRQLFQRTLDREKDPVVLGQAIGLLPVMHMGADEMTATVTRLQTLLNHESVFVRGPALQTLAEIDASAMEQRIHGALTDASTDMRRVAIGVIASSGLRSDMEKSALMGLLHDSNEAIEVRADAAQALESFALNTEERAAYNRFATEIERSYAIKHPTECISVGQPRRQTCDASF